MTVASATRDQQSDARLALGVAATCAAAFPVFVLLPYAAGDGWSPPGLEVLWALGMLLSVLVAPVAAGLAGWSSLVALWAVGDLLPASARRQHLVTLLLVAAYAVALAAAWAGGVFVWFDD